MSRNQRGFTLATQGVRLRRSGDARECHFSIAELDEQHWLSEDRREYSVIRMLDEVLTVAELAEYLKVNRNTIYKLLKAHKLPAFKIGGDYRFSLKQIDELRLSQDPGWGRRVERTR